MEETYPNIQKKISKESIFTALMRLIEEKSYNDITITQITTMAGVSRMAFYRNYQSKDDIIVGYLDDLFDEIMDRMKRSNISSKYDITLLYFTFFKEKSDFISVLINAKLIHMFYEQHRIAMTNFFKNWEAKIQDTPAFTNYLSQFAAAGLFGILSEWIKGGLLETAEEMTAFVCKIT